MIKPPVGRPTIPEADKRKLQRIFSANEFARVKAKAAAAGMTAAAWVRKVTAEAQ